MNNANVSIIKLLLEYRNEDLNISRIATILSKDYKTVHTIVKRLERLGVINIKEFGKSLKVELINKLHPTLFLAEYERREEILKSKNFSVMLDTFLEGIKTKCFILLLFGSHAKRKATKNSDIDLMFIIPDEDAKHMDSTIHNISSLLPLKIHINVFKESEFIKMKNSKETTVGSEAIKNNIILYGIEIYYELIK